MKVSLFIGTASLVLMSWLAASYTQQLSVTSYLLDASPAILEAALGTETEAGEPLTVVD